ncbi:MAG: AraC family transcriptional regulator [Clostridia bacterium]|nr:AraC family transcriptional regulator [Clostridia bacterium]
MSGQCYKDEYIRRIHKVQDYIEEHMDEALTLDVLADTAGFSKFHFSRIFQGILREPLAHYVNRIRMENALFLLAHRPDKNITEIALELGFTDSSVFSRAFKNYHGVTPREYRQEYSKNCKDSFLLSEYNGRTAKNRDSKEHIPVTGAITIEKLPNMQAAYVRHTGSYESLETEFMHLIETLVEHAGKQGICIEEQTMVFAVYHDNPEFAQEYKFRTSLCISVPSDVDIIEDGILTKMELEGGLYAVGHFEIKKEQFPDVWDFMYQEWLTGSGYIPRNSYPFEVYQNAPYEDGGDIVKVDIYVPVEPICF